MHAVEFTTELSGSVLQIPQDVAAQLPQKGPARIIILTEGDPDDIRWRVCAYEQFMHDDSSEDAVYDNYG